jgi:beta-phosphoglucomutase
MLSGTPEFGFIFDLDGVLTDTAEYHYQSWSRLAGEKGWQFSREHNDLLRGVSRIESLNIILRLNNVSTLTEAEKHKLATQKNDYYLQHLKEISDANLLPGVRNLLNESKSRSISIGLASASKNAREVCGRLGIWHFFEATGDGLLNLRGKPAPDIFIWTAGRLGLPANRCIVFEDAEAGVEGALEGGFKVVGLGDPARVGKANLVRPSLDSATVDEFLPLLQGA